jgi:O-methyltransferase
MSRPSTFPPFWKLPLRCVRKLIQQAGYELVQQKYLDALPTDPDSELIALLEEIRPFTMTSNHRLASTADAVRYVVANDIEGALVECGVWRGGNMMIAAKVLVSANQTSREIFMFDTFEGMSPPTNEDEDYRGVPASEQLAAQQKGTGVWCEASIEDVRANMQSTGYPMDRIHLVKGMVESTIPSILPQKIAVLRLDTDWYQSTKHELEHLFPLLVPGGVLIVDDYGHWRGSRQAVDEYFALHGIKPMLNRIDFSCRSMVKV